MLTALLLIPFLAVIVLNILPEQLGSRIARSVGIIVSSGLLVLTLILATQFNPTTTTTQFSENIPWIQWLGFNYSLGLDGLSFPLMLLNGLLTLIAICSTVPETPRPRFYYSLILLLNAGVSGAFLAQDLLLFFLFYELEIIPLYFLIAIWGGARKGYAAMKFLIYTALSGILVLGAFLGLVWFSGASSFALEPLKNQHLPLTIQFVLLSALLVGLFIKIPIFPFHTWLPDAHVEASTPVSVLLAGVLLKLGTYGLLRFGVGLFLDAWVKMAPWLAILAAVSALYGAFTAIAQEDMKKVVAYSSIAHMAYILLAAAATTPLSMIAAVMQMVSHGLISALLFLLVGVVYRKTGSRNINVLRGLLNPERGLPIIGSLMILGAMASAGIPGMVGFIAEFMVFRSAFPIFPVATLFCMVGTGLTAVYFLLTINRVFFGRLTPQLANLPRVNWLDRLPSLVLAVFIVILGIQPSLMTYWSEAQTTALIVKPSLVPINMIDESRDLVSKPMI